jgi:hypothetical protein
VAVLVISLVSAQTEYRSERFHFLFVAVDNAATIEVVRTELNRDAVAGENANEVFTHAPGNMSEGLMLILKLDLEHGIRQGLDDDCHHFNCIFLRQTLSFGRLGLEPLVPLKLLDYALLRAEYLL